MNHVWMIGLGLVLALGPGLSRGDEPKPGAEDPEAAKVLAAHLMKFKGADSGRLSQVGDKAVAKAFPKHYFYVLRFPLFPVARVPAEPLASNNLFVVTPDKKVEHFTDAKGLAKFFTTALEPVQKAEAAETALQAWLGLVPEFHQDGFYKFGAAEDVKATMTKDLPPSMITVTGKVPVKPEGGNKGEITGKLTFEKGKLATADQTAKLFPGPRPICQAKRLLDPDPLVRAMAEQTLLVMGSAAKDYLMEQRASAAPELQKAIDRIWNRIQDEGR